MDLSQLESFLNDPDLAIANLSTLFAALIGVEEERNLATEALENCGPPKDASIPSLLERLDQSNAECQYWASTLLGRFATDTSDPTLLRTVEIALRNALERSNQSPASRERTAWALGRFPSLEKETISLIKSLIPGSSERLKRLLEEAVHQSAS